MYRKERLKVKKRLQKLLQGCNQLFYYGSTVDSWFPELVLTPYVSLQWGHNPVWLRAIAPPSCGKSEHFSLVEESDLTYTIDVFTPKAFISGFREQGGNDPSVLPQLNGRVVIISDESTLMEQSEKDRNEVQSLLRRIYDGKLSKKFGNMQEKQEYSAHFNLLIGSTPSIDRQFQYQQSLGERYVNYRLQIPNRSKLTDAAYNNLFNDFNRDKDKLKRAYCKFIERIPSVEMSEVLITDENAQLLKDCADTIALVRTHINREKASKAVSVLPQPESAPRLVKQMTQFALADAVVCGDEEVTDIHIQKAMYIGLSSVKATVIFTLYHIINREKQPGVKKEKLWFTPMELHIISRLSRNTLHYILEDLAIHRILDIRSAKSGVGSKVQYKLSDAARNLFGNLRLFNDYIPTVDSLLSLEGTKKVSKKPPAKFKKKVEDSKTKSYRRKHNRTTV